MAGRGVMLGSLLILGVAAAPKIPSSDDPEIVFQEPVFSEVLVTKNDPGPADSDPLWGEQWHFENRGQSGRKGTQGVVDADIRLPRNLDRYEFREVVTLAIIDTGLDLNHLDLDRDGVFLNAGESGFDEFGKEKSANGRDDDNNGFVDDVRGWNFADGLPFVSDGRGHGTHLSGEVVAKSGNGIGVAAPWFAVRLLPIQIFSSAHPSASSEKIAAAIHYAVDMGAKVINASFGTPSYSEALAEAVAYAETHDVLFVSAAGNMRRSLDVEPDYPSSFGFRNQLVVGASERRDLYSLFSNFGKVVDIAAPGEEILSLGLNDAYLISSGTSQAAPLVSATAAMLRAIFPRYSASQIKARILAAADEKPALIPFVRTGRRLNVANSLDGRVGLRLPVYDETSWERIALSIESEHPYRSRINSSFKVQAPSGVRRFRIHFSRLQTQTYDLVAIQSGGGQIVALLSGSLGEYWSPVIEGNEAELIFSTDEFGMDWGFAVDSILAEMAPTP